MSKSSKKLPEHQAPEPQGHPDDEVVHVPVDAALRMFNRTSLFRILAEAGQLLTRPLQPDEIFDPLLELVEKALQPERAFLLLKDEQDHASEAEAAEESEEMPAIVASRVRTGGPGGMILSQTLVRRVLEQRTAFLTEDASQDQRLLGGDSIVGSGTRSAMAAPLFDNERVIGILYADTTNPSVHYDRDELKAFVLLANVVAVAITHARFHALEEERRRREGHQHDADQRGPEGVPPHDSPQLRGHHVGAGQDDLGEGGREGSQTLGDLSFNPHVDNSKTATLMCQGQSGPPDPYRTGRALIPSGSCAPHCGQVSPSAISEAEQSGHISSTPGSSPSPCSNTPPSARAVTT